MLSAPLSHLNSSQDRWQQAPSRREIMRAYRQFSCSDTATEDVESTRGGEDVRMAMCTSYAYFEL